MEKTVSKLLALAMAASLVLSGCGGSGSSNGTTENGDATSASSENEVKDLIIPRVASREWKLLTSSTARDWKTLKT